MPNTVKPRLTTERKQREEKKRKAGRANPKNACRHQHPPQASAPQSGATAPPIADQSRDPQLRAKLNNADLRPPSVPALAKAEPGQASPASAADTFLLQPDPADVTSNAAEIRLHQPGPPCGSQSTRATTGRPRHPATQRTAQRQTPEPPLPQGGPDAKDQRQARDARRTRGQARLPRAASSPRARRPAKHAPRAPAPKSAVRAAIRPDQRWPLPPGVERAPLAISPIPGVRGAPGAPSIKARPSAGGPRLQRPHHVARPLTSGRQNTATGPRRGPPWVST
ncbi:hypothetical protein NDU88_004199 [Pleurodeles waltl]|uniref:Uncharacterized protein n=1 Tax=Pleurodeles waltl TaxID=8319 RepID=A0AAV7L099_PLEWA|nr:hypothetical protein NDU88_004199 [Pleurodeles waltl]